MRYPAFLKENGRIGFIAPSFGCAFEPYLSAFNNAKAKLSEMGHDIYLGENCYLQEGIGISNTPEKCAKELVDNYTGDTCDVIISCGGGELMCETIEKVDFEKIKKADPKWYLGYSDNTNFVFLNTILCDTAGIYGPCAGAFGMEPWHESIWDTYELLTGKKLTVKGYDKWEIEGGKDEEHPLLPYNVTEPKILKYAGSVENIGQASFEGRLIGGCVDCLVTLLGTKYDKVREFTSRYEDEGILWFLECCDLNIMSMRRAFWQMKNAGWFEHVKGFLIGRPRIMEDEMMGLQRYEAVAGVLREFGVPIIMDCDIGHLAPMMPLICGSHGVVNANGNDISVEMKLI